MFGEFGAGFYHYSGEIGTPFPELTGKGDGNDFTALFGVGLEVDLSDNASFAGQGRLNIFNTESETLTIFDLMGGVTINF